MCTKILQSKEELQSHLEEQIRFIESSANSFDSGFTGEAKRLAVSLRLLLHDTSNCKSLLTQLEIKNAPFIDTSVPNEAGNVGSYSGLIFINLEQQRPARFLPMLDDAPCKPQNINFEDWWNGVSFIDNENKSILRKDVVLSVANQDGGAHVDPNLNKVYARLSRQNSLSWFYTGAGKTIPIKEPERAAIRQIAHEVLKTLNPKYTKNLNFSGVLAAGASIVPQESTKPRVKVGRNDPCPCGSRKKYKKCCGR